MQRYANLATRFWFELNGTLNTCNYRTNHIFAEAVDSLLDSCSGCEATDFITVGDALEQVTQDLGITVSHSTVVRWIAIHGLGHKLEGIKGQWIVYADLFNQFLVDKPLTRKSKLFNCP